MRNKDIILKTIKVHAVLLNPLTFQVMIDIVPKIYLLVIPQLRVRSGPGAFSPWGSSVGPIGYNIWKTEAVLVTEFYEIFRLHGVWLKRRNFNTHLCRPNLSRLHSSGAFALPCC